MDLLLPLHLPPYPFRITEQDGQLTLFDVIRKKKIIITPEEWVRQHFVQFLILQKHYPKTLIKLEGGHKLHGMPKRTDIIVYNNAGEKILLVECKAPSIPVNQKTFDQVARYNLVHKTNLLAVTNGLEHFYCRVNFERREYKFIDELPDYKETLTG